MAKRLLGFMLLISGMIFHIAQAQSETKSSSFSSPLTIEEAVVTALQQNPELRAMQKEVDASNAKIPQARSWDDPQIGVRLYQVPFNGGVGNAQDIDYIVAQKFPFPGKKKAASQIAYYEYLRNIELLGGRGRELLRDVKTAYFGLFSVNRLIDLSRNIEGTLRKIVQTAQVKLAAGQAMSTDAILGQAEISKILTDRQPLYERKKALEAKLNQLMARPNQEEIILSSKLELPRWEIPLEKLLPIAQQRHPSVKAAEKTIDQKKWALKAARRDYFPDLSAQMEYIQRPGAAPGGAPAPNAWTGEFMLNIPLIVKKKMKGVEQAEAELASAQYSHSAAENEVTAKVKEAYAKLKASERMWAINQNTLLPQTRQALEVTTTAYTTGKGDFITLLTAARSFFDAQTEYWKTFESLADAAYELEEAVGATLEEFSELKREK